MLCAFLLWTEVVNNYALLLEGITHTDLCFPVSNILLLRGAYWVSYIILYQRIALFKGASLSSFNLPCELWLLWKSMARRRERTDMVRGDKKYRVQFGLEPANLCDALPDWDIHVNGSKNFQLSLELMCKPTLLSLSRQVFGR